jgi:hypothetical protein
VKTHFATRPNKALYATQAMQVHTPMRNVGRLERLWKIPFDE